MLMVRRRRARRQGRGQGLSIVISNVVNSSILVLHISVYVYTCEMRICCNMYMCVHVVIHRFVSLKPVTGTAGKSQMHANVGLTTVTAM